MNYVHETEISKLGVYANYQGFTLPLVRGAP